MSNDDGFLGVVVMALIGMAFLLLTYACASFFAGLL